MSPPILFLDVDGVLNTRATRPGAEGVRECVLQRPYSLTRFTGVVEIVKVRAIASLVLACGATIVVSSSWRNAFADAASFAAAIGIAPPLADAPDLFHRDWRTESKLSSQRFHEISWWLDDHEFVRRYAVLDDHPVFPRDYHGARARHEVRTDPALGITNTDLNLVAELLGRPDLARMAGSARREPAPDRRR